MIALKIGNDFLDLPDKMKMTFDFKNNLFEAKVNQGSFSYGFEAPDTEKNQGILGALGNPHSQKLFQENIVVGLYLLGVYIADCELLIKGKKKGMYKLEINVIYGDILKKISNKTLKDIINDSYTIPYITYMNEFPDPFGIGFDNYYYYNLDRSLIYDTVELNFTDPATGISHNYARNLIDFDSDLDKTIYQVFVDFSVDYPIIKYFDFTRLIIGDTVIFSTISGDFLTEYAHNPFALTLTITAGGGFTSFYFKKKTIQHLELQRIYDDFVFLPVYNPDFYGGQNPDFPTIKGNGLGAYNYEKQSSNGLINFSWNSDSLDTPFPKNCLYAPTRVSLVPFLKLSYLIEKVFQFCGYTVEGDFLDDSELSTLVVYNTFTLDKKVEEFAFEFNEFTNLIEYRNHVPNWSVEEFINEISSFFNFEPQPNFSSKKVLLKYRQDTINQTSINFESKLFLDDSEEVELKKNIQLKFAENQNYQEGSSLFFDSVTSGSFTETNPIEFKFGTLKWDDNHKAVDNQKANTPLFGIGTNNDFAPKLAFVRLQSPEYQSYISGKAESGYNYALTLDGAKGIVAMFWEDYLNFLLKNKKFSGEIKLDINDLRRFFLGKFPKVRYDYLDFFIDTIRLELENSPNPFRNVGEITLWKKPL